MPRKHSLRKHKRGGNQDVPEVDLTPPPIVEQPLKYGATSPAEEAILHQQMMNENQQRMNDGLPPLEQTGGGEGGIVVPQVDSPLPSSPNDANSMATKMNELLLQQNADAQFDGQVGKVTTGGRRRHHRRRTHKKSKKSKKTGKKYYSRKTKKTRKSRKNTKK